MNLSTVNNDMKRYHIIMAGKRSLKCPVLFWKIFL